MRPFDTTEADLDASVSELELSAANSLTHAA
jgi:hypothetical protein